MVLWKRNRDLGLISQANNQPGLDKNLALGPNDELNPSPSLLLTLPGFIFSQSHKEQQIEALKNLSQLIELVREQKKNTERDFLLTVTIINGM